MRTAFLNRILVFCLMLGANCSVIAQADVDSPYSLFGVGQLSGKTMNVRLKGMGGVSNAMFGGGIINAGNPASYARIDSLAFLFDAGFYFKSSAFSTSSFSESSVNASFNFVSMAFGLMPWWKMAIGVQPYSSSGYTMLVNSNQPGIGGYTMRFKGSGGLNEAFWGNAFKIGKHLTVGANAYYVFGNTQTETTLYFPDSSYCLGSRRSVDLMTSSFRFDYGALYNANIGNGMQLNMGITYTQKANLRGNQTLFIRSIEEDIDTQIEYLLDTVAYKSYKTRTSIPQGLGAGVALGKKDRWAVGVDFDWTQWSKFGRHEGSDSLQDSWRVSAGAEFIPKHSSVSNYFSRVTYRFGGFFERGCIKLEGNDGIEHSINKIGVTAGMTLPLPRTRSTVNLAVEMGQYGMLDGGLIQERYIKMDVGVSVFERWFMKRKYN